LTVELQGHYVVVSGYLQLLFSLTSIGRAHNEFVRHEIQNVSVSVSLYLRA